MVGCLVSLFVYWFASRSVIYSVNVFMIQAYIKLNVPHIADLLAAVFVLKLRVAMF